LAYEDIKKHIDDRFINNGTSGKGISQIIAQIDDLIEGKSEDEELNTKLRFKQLTIYPIICHDEINYHMLGLNSYLEQRFRQGLSGTARGRYRIKPLTLINMRTLYELASRKLTFGEFIGAIDRYHGIIANRLKRQVPEFSPPFYNAQVGFEDIYRAIMHPEFVKSHPVSSGKLWMDGLGLTQEELDEEI
jgi:hypothetical protein